MSLLIKKKQEIGSNLFIKIFMSVDEKSTRNGV